MKPASQFPAKLFLALPVTRFLPVEPLRLADRVREILRDAEPPGDVGELPIEDADECKEVVALVFERPADGADAVRA